MKRRLLVAGCCVALISGVVVSLTATPESLFSGTSTASTTIAPLAAPLSPRPAEAGAAPSIAVAPQDWSNEDCMMCHGESDVVDMAEQNPRDGLVVDPAVLAGSVHADFDCVFCHEDITDIPHEPVLEPVDPLVCSTCHDDVYDDYAPSAHGRANAGGDQDAANCSDCHGAHDILPTSDEASPVYALNLPATCGTCHADEILAQKHAIPVPDAYQRYVESVHGRGLLRAGLLVSATCTDCHAAHAVFPNTDERARLFRTRVPDTCGTCHQGVLRQYAESVHGRRLAEGDPEVPVCTTCHATHAIPPAFEPGFRAAAVAECGTCHADKLDTYRGTLHGKANELGQQEVAACSSCHTAHHNLPASDPASTIAPTNLPATCASCHVGAGPKFAEYQVHADPTDRQAYPLLFFVYFGMVTLLSATMVGGALHTWLWYRRLRQQQHETGKSYRREEFWHPSGDQEYVRFTAFNRVLHMLVMSSFLILVATGVPLHFSGTRWASAVTGFFGGVTTAGYLHRFGAIVMFVYIFMHLGYLGWLRFGKGHKGILWGPESLMPNHKDFRDFAGQIKWFLGKGPQPQFGRWTYWEKFDYFADAWGCIVFGTTGFILWFPVFFTQWLPGWAINIAIIMHGFEALLALSFIFTVHFFNAHLRPGKFPMDPVFLTGRITLEELQEERPLEYQHMIETGQLEENLAEPSSPLTLHYSRLIGYTALTVGLVLVALVLISLLLQILF